MADRKYWAMRTTRDNEKSREFIRREFLGGRLRQGWGWADKLDLHKIQAAWAESQALDPDQVAASRHWRMANGKRGEYMSVGDVILVPNMPEDGCFALCRVSGEYEFGPDHENEWGDFRHIRPVEVLTPDGVANEHKLVTADLRRSLRCRSRLWNITAHGECIEGILSSDPSKEDLRRGIRPRDRAEGFVGDAITKQIDDMSKRLMEGLPLELYGSEWEKAIMPALESLFTVTVNHTGGSGERGADLEVVISNPFEEDLDWIIPMQVKDHQDIENSNVVGQLEEAFESRNEHNRVIAVVLLVTQAEASAELKEELKRLTKEKRVPFLYCGRSDFMRVLAKGFLRQL